MTNRDTVGQRTPGKIAPLRKLPTVFPTATVRWGSDRRRCFRHRPHVGIAHLAESLAAEGGVLEPDFRNRYEEKPTYSSV